MAKKISGSVGKGGKNKPENRIGLSPAMSISGSVGTGGRNAPADVKVIQALINDHIHRIPPTRALAVNGIAGPDTIAAITRFQRIVMQLPMPDGRVDADGKTWDALTG